MHSGVAARGLENHIVARPKSEYDVKFRADLDKFVQVSGWTPQQKAALACRILDRDGHESSLAGQVSARGEKPGTYYALSFGLGFDEAGKNNILLVILRAAYTASFDVRLTKYWAGFCRGQGSI